jgi:hypothetical protein
MATPSLYERLGGVYSIATVVDDFLLLGIKRTSMIRSLTSASDP